MILLGKNKRAGSVYLQMMFGFFKFFLVLFIVFSILFVVRSHFKAKIDILDTELTLLAHNIIYAKGGVSYQDPITGRVYPGVISLEEFENSFAMSSRLNQAFFYEKQPVFAAVINLNLPEQNKKVESVYYYKEWYDKWHPLGASRLIGKGAVIKKTMSFNVLVRQKTSPHDIPGILTMEIVTPRP